MSFRRTHGQIMSRLDGAAGCFPPLRLSEVRFPRCRTISLLHLSVLQMKKGAD